MEELSQEYLRSKEKEKSSLREAEFSDLTLLGQLEV